MADKFTDDQVELALTELVGAFGNVREAVKRIQAHDDAFAISETTLRKWKTETYREQFMQLESTLGEDIESEVVARARKNALRALEIEADLLETAAKAGPEEASSALKAVADSKNKNIDKVLSLTGRPQVARDDAVNPWQMIESMAEKGYLQINVGLPSAAPAPATDSTAEEDPPELDKPST
jgi:hypothetical protein